MRRGVKTGLSDTPEDRPRRAYGVQVHWRGQVVDFEAYEDEFILDAAIRNGLPLAHLCNQGWCTRCAVRIEQGEVDQSSSRRFYTEDREAGFSLICTAKPLSGLRVLADRHEEFREHRIGLGLPVPRG